MRLRILDVYVPVSDFCGVLALFKPEWPETTHPSSRRYE